MNTITLEKLCNVFETNNDTKTDQLNNIDCFYTSYCFKEIINQINTNYNCYNKYKIVFFYKDKFIIRNLNTMQDFDCFFTLDLKTYYKILKNQLILFEGRTYNFDYYKEDKFKEILKYCYGVKHFLKNLDNIKHLPKNDFKEFENRLIKYNKNILKTIDDENEYDITFKDLWYNGYGFQWNGSNYSKNNSIHNKSEINQNKKSKYFINENIHYEPTLNNSNFSSNLLNNSYSDMENSNNNITLILSLLTPFAMISILFIFIILFIYKRKKI